MLSMLFVGLIDFVVVGDSYLAFIFAHGGASIVTIGHVCGGYPCGVAIL